MKPNTIFVIFSALIVVVGVYWYSRADTGDQPFITASTPEENLSKIRFQTLVQGLPTSFDTSIFSDVRFRALFDLTTQVSSEPAGRLDPFASIQEVVKNENK